MTLLLATGLFTFSLVTLVIAFPARNAREEARPVQCDIRSFQENVEISKITRNGLGVCIRVEDAIVPTSIKITCSGSPPSSPKLHTFASDDCVENDAISTTPISLHGLGNNRVAARMNDRTPICSFRLHDNAIDPVKITFKNAHNTHDTISINNSCVPDLCGEGPDVLPKYAASVDLHEVEDGSVSYNSVDLFSDNRCEARIQNEGKFGVRSGADLVSLTRPNSVTVQSFRLTL